MKKLTESGKLFFGIIVILAVILLVASYKPAQHNAVYFYCTPDCTQQALPIGYTTLAKNCFFNQTECQVSQQPQAPSSSKIIVAFNDSIHKIQGIGTVTMLDLNVTNVYIRENNQPDWIPLLSAP